MTACAAAPCRRQPPPGKPHRDLPHPARPPPPFRHPAGRHPPAGGRGIHLPEPRTGALPRDRVPQHHRHHLLPQRQPGNRPAGRDRAHRGGYRRGGRRAGHPVHLVGHHVPGAGHLRIRRGHGGGRAVHRKQHQRDHLPRRRGQALRQPHQQQHLPRAQAERHRGPGTFRPCSEFSTTTSCPSSTGSTAWARSTSWARWRNG